MRRYYLDPGNLGTLRPPRRPRSRTVNMRTLALCPCCACGKLTLRQGAYPGLRVASLRCYKCGCEWGLNPSFLGAHLRVGGSKDCIDAAAGAAYHALKSGPL